MQTHVLKWMGPHDLYLFHMIADQFGEAFNFMNSSIDFNK